MEEGPEFTPEKTGASCAWAWEFMHNSPRMKTHPEKHTSQQLRLPPSCEDAGRLAPQAATPRAKASTLLKGNFTPAGGTH